MSDDPSDDPIAYRYQEAQNTEERPVPGGEPIRAPIAFIPGVPLRDLTVSEVAALPKHLHRSVAASPIYKATSDAPEAPAEPPDPDAPAEEPRPRARRRPAPEADAPPKEG